MVVVFSMFQEVGWQHCRTYPSLVFVACSYAGPVDSVMTRQRATVCVCDMFGVGGCGCACDVRVWVTVTLQ